MAWRLDIPQKDENLGRNKCLWIFLIVSIECCRKLSFLSVSAVPAMLALYVDVDSKALGLLEPL